MHKVFYSPAYASASHTFDTTRKARWIAESLSLVPIPGVVLEEPEPLSIETVLETHSEEYVDAIATGEPLGLAMSQGFQWCLNVLPSVLSSNGGIVEAVRAALEDGVAGTLSSGMHHARRDAGLGFCTFNGLAIAAKEAVKLGCEEVLILDLDAHGGGGTDELISGNVRISHLDLAVDRFDLHHDTIDLSGKSPLDYLTVLDAALAECSPSLVIYNAGMDVSEHDSGPPGFDKRVIAAREATVFAWAASRKIPICYTLAGGYTTPNQGRADLIGLHRSTIRTAAHFYSERTVACRA